MAVPHTRSSFTALSRQLAVKYVCVVVILLGAFPAVAEDWYAGVGLGIFDVDRKQANAIEPATHFDSSTANLFVGYDFSKYLGVEVQLEGITRGFETDIDGFRSEFGGYGVSPALIVKYPLSEEYGMEIFVRAGATYLDYTIANLSLGRKVDETTTQPMFGAGLRSEYFFVEYVNYGKSHDMDLEQLRVGFRSRF